MSIRANLLCALAAASFTVLPATSPSQALTMMECSAKYQAAKTAGTLNGEKWNDFRKTQCGADASLAPAPPAPDAAATVPANKGVPEASPLKPVSIDNVAPLPERPSAQSQATPTINVVAPTGSRVALVIGNSTYQNAPLLPNPSRDATDISAALQRLSFQVKLLTNVTYDGMRRGLIDFSRQAQGAEIAFIYFAGHGMEIGGENWLIPVDAQLETDVNVANETIGLQSMTRAVSNTTRLGLVVLDACRSNPFIPKMHTTNVTRAVDRGFSRVEPSENVLVAYAARDGTTAQDGTGRNSPFTRSLLKNIETPDLEIRFLFATVRDEVMGDTHREQQPYIYGSLSREMVYLKPSPKPGKVETPTSDSAPPVNSAPAASSGLTAVATATPAPRETSQDRIAEAKTFSAGNMIGGDSLGLTLAELDPNTRARYSVKPSIRGVVVTAVKPGSAAAESKLQEGDIIVEIRAGNGMDQVFNEINVRSRIEQAKGSGLKAVLLFVRNNEGEPSFPSLRLRP